MSKHGGGWRETSFGIQCECFNGILLAAAICLSGIFVSSYASQYTLAPSYLVTLIAIYGVANTLKTGWRLECRRCANDKAPEVKTSPVLAQMFDTDFPPAFGHLEVDDNTACTHLFAKSKVKEDQSASKLHRGKLGEPKVTVRRSSVVSTVNSLAKMSPKKRDSTPNEIQKSVYETSLKFDDVVVTTALKSRRGNVAVKVLRRLYFFSFVLVLAGVGSYVMDMTFMKDHLSNPCVFFVMLLLSLAPHLKTAPKSVRFAVLAASLGATWASFKGPRIQAFFH